MGYSLLGELVRTVTGDDPLSEIGKRFFDPLGMANTGWQPGHYAARGYYVHPYDDCLIEEPNFETQSMACAAQAWSNATDLLLWGHALIGGRPDILSPDIVDAMHSVQIMLDQKKLVPGLGIGTLVAAEK